MGVGYANGFVPWLQPEAHDVPLDAMVTDEGVPTTFLLTSFYWDNLIHFGMQPQRGPDGVLQFVLPMGPAKMPGIAAGRSASSQEIANVIDFLASPGASFVSGQTVTANGGVMFPG